MGARTPSLALAVLGLAVVLAAPASAGAGPGLGTHEPAADHPDGVPLSLDDAVELVKRRYDARVLRAEEAKQGEDVVYRIRLLAADGRVFSVQVNARTGSVE